MLKQEWTVVEERLTIAYDGIVRRLPAEGGEGRGVGGSAIGLAMEA